MSDFHSSRLRGYPKTSSLAQGLCHRHAASPPLCHTGLRHHRAASLTHRQLGGWAAARLADHFDSSGARCRPPHRLATSTARGLGHCPPRRLATSTARGLGRRPPRRLATSTARGLGHRPPRRLATSTARRLGRRPPRRLATSTARGLGRRPPRRLATSTARGLGRCPPRRLATSTARGLGRRPPCRLATSTAQGLGRRPPRRVTTSTARGLGHCSPRRLTTSPARRLGHRPPRRHAASLVWELGHRLPRRLATSPTRGLGHRPPRRFAASSTLGGHATASSARGCVTTHLTDHFVSSGAASHLTKTTRRSKLLDPRMEDTIRKTFEDYKEKSSESRIWIFKLIVSQVNLKLEGLWGMDIPWVQMRRIIYMGRPTDSGPRPMG
jgi:hypothetical protein